MESIERSLPPSFNLVNSNGAEDLSYRKDYTLDVESGKLYHRNPDYGFELRPGGFIPKSGIHLADYFLTQYGQAKINSALEIGVGELAFLPITLVKNNLAEKVDGIEVDPMALTWSKHNVNANNIHKKIALYDSLKAVDSNRYDLIFSNPPQMPVPQNKSLHDDGGTDGYQIIDQIINYSHTHLHDGGRLVLLVFDFLNIAKAYNDTRPPLTDALRQHGYAVDIRRSIFRAIRPGGKTEQSLDWIKRQYPLYEFRNGNQVDYNLLILEATKNKK